MPPIVQLCETDNFKNAHVFMCATNCLNLSSGSCQKLLSENCSVTSLVLSLNTQLLARSSFLEEEEAFPLPGLPIQGETQVNISSFLLLSFAYYFSNVNGTPRPSGQTTVGMATLSSSREMILHSKSAFGIFCYLYIVALQLSNLNFKSSTPQHQAKKNSCVNLFLDFYYKELCMTSYFIAT